MKRLSSLFVVFLWVVADAAGEDANRFTMALTGDTEITRKLSVHSEPEFLKMVDILRNTDVAFTNLELLLHDYEGWAEAEADGPYQRVDPALADELVWLGIDIVSRANNHAKDYGVTGMRVTSKHVLAAGLVEAGTGESLPEAREARYFDTPAGRVALISVASTFPSHQRAGKPRTGIPARPGLNPLRHSRNYVVTRERFDLLKATMNELGMSGRPGFRWPPSDSELLNVLGNRFVVGGVPDVRTEPHPGDLEEIMAVVRNASEQADYVMVTIHAHKGYMKRWQPAEFLVTFAHALMDAGADVFVGHGPLILRGVEIYNGKPILYSVGNFIYENETLDRLPEDNYEWYGLGPNAGVADFMERHYDSGRRGFPGTPMNAEAVIAVPEWRSGAFHELRLYPISLGHGKPRTVRGRPMLAEPALAKKILDDVIRFSAPYGTHVEIRDNVGIIRVGGAASDGGEP